MEEKKKTKSQIICDAICGALMLVSIAVYLILGITINWWHPGWVVIVSAAVVSGLIGIVSNTCANLKEADKHEDKHEDKE